jgi:hypothetical protein
MIKPKEQQNLKDNTTLMKQKSGMPEQQIIKVRLITHNKLFQ